MQRSSMALTSMPGYKMLWRTEDVITKQLQLPREAVKKAVALLDHELTGILPALSPLDTRAHT
jgi:hypothetical protein